MIFVDERVGSSERKSRSERLDEFLTLIRSHRIDADSSRYDSGDFYFEGNGPNGRTIDVGIERKTLRDLLTSIRNNRLGGEQIPLMLATYDVSWIIVEGIFRPDAITGILQEYRNGSWVDLTIGRQTFMHSEVERFLMQISMTVAMEYPGRPLLTWVTSNVKETVGAIASLYVQLRRKKWDDHRSLGGIHMPVIREPVVFHKRTPEEENAILRRRIAMCFSGLSNERAKAVATRFRSAREFANADEGALREIPGIGKGIAGSLVREWTNAEGEGVKRDDEC